MEQLKELLWHANSLKSYAMELESTVQKVESTSAVLPEKLSLVTTMQNATQEMYQVAELLDNISHEHKNDKKLEVVSDRDSVLLHEASEYRKNIQECISQLGEVLNELVMNTSLGDEQTLLWMSRYVAETRMYLAFLRDLFPEFVKENS